jgi:hypothetical protein
MARARSASAKGVFLAFVVEVVVVRVLAMLTPV